MRAEGLRPDRFTYMKAVRTCWFSQQPELAAALTAEMVGAGIPPDGRFYRVQIAAARDVGLLDEADRMHREAAAAKVSLGRGQKPRDGARHAARQQ